MTYYYVRQYTRTSSLEFEGKVEVKHGTGSAELYTSNKIPPGAQRRVGKPKTVSQYSKPGDNQLSGEGREAEDWEVEFKPINRPFKAKVMSQTL